MGIALIVPNISFAGAPYGRVTPAEDTPITGLGISGPSSVVGGEGAAQYIADYTPATTSQRAVSWSIVSGSAYATIDTSGVVSILRGASSSAVTIRVTSVVNPSIFAEKTISVTYERQQGDLPEDAIPAELLYSTGYSSFINTNIVPSARMSYEADVVWVKPNDNYSSFFGYNINNVRFSFHRAKNTGYDEVGYGSAHTGAYPTTSKRYQRVKLKVSVTESGASVETYAPDGTLLNTETISYSEAVSFVDTIGLLGRKKTATTMEDGTFRGGLGRFKLYGDENFRTLVADFIPCYYQDNFGFWDSVSESFLIGTTPSDIFGFGEEWGTQGFSPNVRNNHSRSESEYFIDYRGCDATRMFEIPAGCANIRFNAGAVDSSNEALMFFDGSGTYISHFTANAADREVAVPSGAVYVRLSYDRTAIASAYIYDITGNNYIWNGGA